MVRCGGRELYCVAVLLGGKAAKPLWRSVAAVPVTGMHATKSTSAFSCPMDVRSSRMPSVAIRVPHKSGTRSSVGHGKAWLRARS